MSFRYAQKAKILAQSYTDGQKDHDTNHDTIIVMVNDIMHGGGLGDRLHGMISMYMFAKKHDLKFKINHVNPFQLSDYFEPNAYDWQIDPDTIAYNLQSAVPIQMAQTWAKYKGTCEEEAAFMKRYLAKVIKKHPSKEYHLYTNAHFASDPETYSRVFHELFKPSERLKEAVEENKSHIGSEYISITLRFQNLLGDFFEGKYPTLPEVEQEELIQRVIDKIKEVHTGENENYKVLVTSDSRKFLDAATKQLDYVYTIPGKIVHMAYTPVHDFNTHLKSFVDLMMLADAEKLYLLVTDNMYRSGFAKSASFINNKPYEEIIW